MRMAATAAAWERVAPDPGPVTPRLTEEGDTVEGIVLKWVPPRQVVGEHVTGGSFRVGYQVGRSYSRVPGLLRLAPVGPDGQRAEGREICIKPDTTIENGDLVRQLAAANLRRGDRVRIAVTGRGRRSLGFVGFPRGWIGYPEFAVDVARGVRRGLLRRRAVPALA